MKWIPVYIKSPVQSYGYLIKPERGWYPLDKIKLKADVKARFQTKREAQLECERRNRQG